MQILANKIGLNFKFVCITLYMYNLLSSDSTDSCDYANCECDRVFLECLRSAGVLRRYLPGYHSYRGPC